MRFFPTNPLGFRVETEELADNSVTTPKLAALAVTTPKLALLAVTAAQIAADTITAAKMAANSVDTVELVNNSITFEKLSDQVQGQILHYIAAGVPAALAVGTSGQVLTSNGAAADVSWEDGVSARELKSNQATWTTAFSTTSATYVDITNATVTLSGLNASKTYNLYSWGTINSSHPSMTNQTAVSRMLLDGTAQSEASVAIGSSSRGPVPYVGLKLGVTGATSYISKLQGQLNGSGNANFGASSRTNYLILQAIEDV